jgi:hypothetical protein
MKSTRSVEEEEHEERRRRKARRALEKMRREVWRCDE